MISDIRPNTQMHEGHPGDVRIRDGGFADIQRTSMDIRLPGGDILKNSEMHPSLDSQKGAKYVAPELATKRILGGYPKRWHIYATILDITLNSIGYPLRRPPLRISFRHTLVNPSRS